VSDMAVRLTPEMTPVRLPPPDPPRSDDGVMAALTLLLLIGRSLPRKSPPSPR
jgi:hypothetical protein